MSEHGVIVGYASSDDDAALDWAAREAKVRDPETVTIALTSDSTLGWIAAPGVSGSHHPAVRRPVLRIPTVLSRMLMLEIPSQLKVVECT